jgi:hypothetical protein
MRNRFSIACNWPEAARCRVLDFLTGGGQPVIGGIGKALPAALTFDVDGDAFGVRQDVFFDGDGDFGQRVIG